MLSQIIGAIRHSVNFPPVSLGRVDASHGGRLCIVNKNESGALGQITTFLGEQGINIVQQVNASRGGVAYTVIDMEELPEDPAALQDELSGLPDVLTSRWIGNPFENTIGTPGTFYKPSF